MYNPFDEKNTDSEMTNEGQRNFEAEKKAETVNTEAYRSGENNTTTQRADANAQSEQQKTDASSGYQQYNPYRVMPQHAETHHNYTDASQQAPTVAANSYTGATPASQYPDTAQSQQSSVNGMDGKQAVYTWGAGQNQNQYYPGTMIPQKAAKSEKKKSGHWVRRVLVCMLCCVVASVSTLGIFVGMIQSGAINIQSSSNGAAAFTINKVVDENSTTNLTEISGKLTAQEVAEKVVPSVVCIQNYQISTQQSYWGNNGRFSNDGTDENGSEVSPSSSGSGIIISEDGYIVTNAHVVDGASKLKVVLSTGITYEAELVGSDSVTDIALIKIDATGLTAADFGSAEDMKVADEVIAIGNPGGIQFNSTVTIGYVSALNRVVSDSDTGYSMSCIQTDAAINPGNSGGALVDMYGHVVGMNSSKIVATGYEGLGFAIPSDTVQDIVSDLKEYGYVKDRPALGIAGQYIDNMTAMFYGFSSAGFYVGELNTENAQNSGLQKGDVITSIDGTTITSESTITSYITAKKPGDTVTLEVVRSSTQETLTIELVLSESSGQ